MFYFLNAMQSNTRTVKPVCNGHPCDPNFEAIVIGALSSGLDLSRVAIWPFLKLFARNIMIWPFFGLFQMSTKIVYFKDCFEQI